MSELGPDGLAKYPGIGEFRTLDIENIWREATTAERDALLEAMDEMPVLQHDSIVLPGTNCLPRCPACAVERFKAEFRKKVCGA